MLFSFMLSITFTLSKGKVDWQLRFSKIGNLNKIWILFSPVVAVEDLHQA